MSWLYGNVIEAYDWQPTVAHTTGQVQLEIHLLKVGLHTQTHKHTVNFYNLSAVVGTFLMGLSGLISL